MDVVYQYWEEGLHFNKYSELLMYLGMMMLLMLKHVVK
jgi:hypothetical protein